MADMRVLLVVEDDPIDQAIIGKALAPYASEIEVKFASDGIDAMQMLKSGAADPDLVLTDLRMPGMDGYGLLASLKCNAELKAIPVIVLSTTDDEDEVRVCYEYHANAFLSKPHSLESYRKMAESIVDFWFGETLLPN